MENNTMARLEFLQKLVSSLVTAVKKMFHNNAEPHLRSMPSAPSIGEDESSDSDSREATLPELLTGIDIPEKSLVHHYFSDPPPRNTDASRLFNTKTHKTQLVCNICKKVFKHLLTLDSHIK